VQPRYPDEIYVDEGLMRQAHSCTKFIKEFLPLQMVRRELEQAVKEENLQSECEAAGLPEK